MKICNVCALFVYHAYGGSSIGLGCDMHVACTGKCDCQALEWIILKSVLWNLSCFGMIELAQDRFQWLVHFAACD